MIPVEILPGGKIQVVKGNNYSSHLSIFRVMLGTKLTTQQGIPGGMHLPVDGHGQHK